MGTILFAHISYHEDGVQLVPHVACHMALEEDVDVDDVARECDRVELRFAVDPSTPGTILMTLMCRAPMQDGLAPSNDTSFDLIGFKGHTNAKTPEIFHVLRNDCGLWRLFLRFNHSDEAVMFDVLPNGKIQNRTSVPYERVQHAFARATIQ